MKQLIKLITIGIIAGIVLAFVMKIIQLLTGSQANVLLYNVDYIPIINQLKPKMAIGIVFHFLTCIVSVIFLFYFLKIGRLEYRLLPYFVVYTGGGGILFFLTALSEKPPSATDPAAWFYWTLGHAIFSLTVGILVKYWR